MKPRTALATVALAAMTMTAAAPASAQQAAYRLKSGATRVAIMPVNCGRDAAANDLCSSLDESLATELAHDPRLEVLAPRDMIVMLGAQELIDLQACTGDECFEPSTFEQVQASYLVAVNIGRIGSDALITSRLVDLRRGTVLDRDDVRVSHIDERLVDEAVRGLVQGMLIRRGIATPLAPEAEAHGTPVVFWTGAVLAVLGGVAVVGGGTVGALSYFDAQKLVDEPVRRDVFDAKAADIERNALFADAGLIGGGVAVAAGVVMLIVGSL